MLKFKREITIQIEKEEKLAKLYKNGKLISELCFSEDSFKEFNNLLEPLSEKEKLIKWLVKHNKVESNSHQKGFAFLMYDFQDKIFCNDYSEIEDNEAISYWEQIRDIKN